MDDKTFDACFTPTSCVYVKNCAVPAKKARAAALEDAAKICEGLFSGRSTSIENIALGKAAAAIRALKACHAA